MLALQELLIDQFNSRAQKQDGRTQRGFIQNGEADHYVTLYNYKSYVAHELQTHKGK